jgi:diguanylate cyclase
MLDRTRQLIHATPIPTREGKVVQVSLSIGLASTASEAGYDYAALMRAADAALYVAKNRGRGQVVNQEEDRPVSSVLRAVSTSTSGEGWQIGGIG